MTFCPSDQKIADLLADTLNPSERDSLARHVEGCASCQQRLACLTDFDTLQCRRPQHPPQPAAPPAGFSSVAEEEIMQRLKRMVSIPLQAAREVPSPQSRKSQANHSLQEGSWNPQATGYDWPTVLGYEILGELGRGGMGVVYRARHLGLGRTVALKMVLTGIAAGPRDLARFRAEAEVIARLQHPNIVQIYDVGEAAGRPYLVLEFVSGGSLAGHLKGRPQPVRSAAGMVETLARAVHVAHANGVIHRDLKPANILIADSQAGASLANRQRQLPGLAPEVRSTHPATDADPATDEDPATNADPATDVAGSPSLKITDFGLAKCAQGEGVEMTVTGEILGTPNYMAPEQAMIPRQPVGPAADVYALGAILYELLTGRPPFMGESALATVLQVLHNEPVSVISLQPNVPRDLETICLKCLRKEPGKRYATALELAEDLGRFLRDESIQARPVTSVEKLWRWGRRHPVPLGLLAAGLLAPLVALVTLSLLSARLVRSSALDSAAQQAELLEEATSEYSRIVTRVEQAHFPVNKTVPPTPGTVPLSIPATFMHDVGEQLAQTSKTGVQVREYSDFPFPWRKGGPQDDFERAALLRLRQSKGQETAHEFTEIGGARYLRYAQARIMQRTCVECHNTHPQSPRKDWKEGDVRGVLVIIRPLDKDEARVGEALSLALLLSFVFSVLCFAFCVSLKFLPGGYQRKQA